MRAPTKLASWRPCNEVLLQGVFTEVFGVNDGRRKLQIHANPPMPFSIDRNRLVAWVACMKTTIRSMHPQSPRINTRLEPASSLSKCLHDQLLWGPSGGTQTAAIFSSIWCQKTVLGHYTKDLFFVSIRSFLLWLHKKMLSQKTSSQPGELVCHWEKCHFSHLRFPPSPLNFPRCNTYPWPPTIGPTSSRPGRTKRSSAQPGLGWHWGSAYKPEDQWHLVGMGQISRYAWTHLFFAVLCIQPPTPNYSNMRTVRTLGLYGYRWSIKFCQQMEDTQTAISTGRWSWLRFPAELTDTSVTISQL